VAGAAALYFLFSRTASASGFMASESSDRFDEILVASLCNP
jgi:hypothetical protein